MDRGDEGREIRLREYEREAVAPSGLNRDNVGELPAAVTPVAHSLSTCPRDVNQTSTYPSDSGTVSRENIETVVPSRIPTSDAGGSRSKKP